MFPPPPKPRTRRHRKGRGKIELKLSLRAFKKHLVLVLILYYFPLLKKLTQMIHIYYGRKRKRKLIKKSKKLQPSEVPTVSLSLRLLTAGILAGRSCRAPQHPPPSPLPVSTQFHPPQGNLSGRGHAGPSPPWPAWEVSTEPEWSGTQAPAQPLTSLAPVSSCAPALKALLHRDKVH